MTVTIKRTTIRRISRPSFADFIRNAKADEKKRVYTAALTEATQSQNDLLAAFSARQQA